jgi:protein-S-isoprenylcysteine O-methyltransferase Ste14
MVEAWTVPRNEQPETNRHAAALLLVGTGVLSHLSGLTAAVGLVVAGVIVIRVVYEEQLLRERYPDYPSYAKSTKALVPYVF